MAFSIESATRTQPFFPALSPVSECENRLPHGSRPDPVGCIKMKNLPVWFDRIALRFPGFEAAFQELDLEKLQVQGSTQDGPASFIPGTSAVNDRLFVLRDQAWCRQYLRRGDSSSARNNLCVSQQIERLTDIKESQIPMCTQQGIELIGRDSVLFHRPSLIPAPSPPKDCRQRHYEHDHTNQG